MLGIITEIWASFMVLIFAIGLLIMILRPEPYKVGGLRLVVVSSANLAFIGLCLIIYSFFI